MLSRAADIILLGYIALTMERVGSTRVLMS